MAHSGIFKLLPGKKKKRQGGRKEAKGRVCKNNFSLVASFLVTLPKDCCLVLSKNYLLCLLFPVIFFKDC